MIVHQPPTDPRTRRTLALLERAMGSLLESQSLGEINVSELCRVAGIHRTTFYKHFSSVGEFAAYMFSTLINGLAVADTTVLPESAADVWETYRVSLAAMLDHVVENRAAYRRLFAGDGDHYFQRIVADVMAARALQAHDWMREHGRELTVEEPTAARMVGAASTAAMGVWAEQEDTDSARRSVQIMESLPVWWQLR